VVLVDGGHTHDEVAHKGGEGAEPQPAEVHDVGGAQTAFAGASTRGVVRHQVLILLQLHVRMDQLVQTQVLLQHLELHRRRVLHVH
jgi:hypothetical protein